MTKPTNQLPKPVVTFATILLVLFSVAQFWFCYSAYAYFLDGHFDPWVPVALICVTIMFRLDIIAALFGFFGAWKGEGPHFSILPWLHIPQPLPLWQALVISVCFLALSYIVNANTRTKPRSYLVRSLWRRSQTPNPTYVPGTGSQSSVTIDQTPKPVEKKEESK